MFGKISIATLWVLLFVPPMAMVYGKDHTRGLRDALHDNTMDKTRKLNVGSIPVLSLINSDNDTKIVDLTNGAVIYVSDLGLAQPSFNINASYTGNVRSVVYGYNNSKYRTETTAPFAFCGNNRDDFFKCDKLGCGTHNVSATPYNGTNGGGTAGAPTSVTFTIDCDPKTEITGLQLINAINDTKVVDLTTNGTIVLTRNIPGMSTPSFNINASYSGPVKSVVYWYNGTKYLTEDVSPFAFCENDKSDFFHCDKLICGEHTVTAVPYPKLYGNGRAGKPFTVTFVIDCSPAPVCPTCVPSNGCFTTSCVGGQCVYTPTKTCPTGESCDPQTGNCRSQNSLRPCVAVIDESDNEEDSYFDAKWAEFRTAYPDRPFCLLQPINRDFVSYPGAGLYLPPTFLNDTKAKNISITREDGKQVIPNPPLADWFALCDIGVYAATGVSFVGLFVDTSGSLTLPGVANMLDNFTKALNASGLTYKPLYNDEEDWILPFLTTLSSL